MHALTAARATLPPATPCPQDDQSTFYSDASYREFRRDQRQEELLRELKQEWKEERAQEVEQAREQEREVQEQQELGGVWCVDGGREAREERWGLRRLKEQGKRRGAVRRAEGWWRRLGNARCVGRAGEQRE